MSNNVFNLPPPPDPAASLIGPELSGHRVIVDGRVIPLLTCADAGSDIHFTLDGRFGCVVPRENACEVAWIIANALAIGQGYSHAGAESKGMPFAPKYMLIGGGEQG